MVLYMNSEDMCGDSDSICEVGRTSTKMDMMCGMLKEMGRVDFEKLAKEIQADKDAVIGSVELVANRALSEKEILSDFKALNQKNASLPKSEKSTLVQITSGE